MYAILAPGQGAQKTGLFNSWLNDEQTKNESLKYITKWSEYAGIDLLELGTNADEETILDTKNTQPLLVSSGLLSFIFLNKKFSFDKNTIVSGHSIGELTAAAIAEIISFEDAIKLAKVRGLAMSNAGKLVDSGMIAVLGGDKDTVLAILKEFNLEPANFNANGQIVGAGLNKDIDNLIANPPEKLRLRKLAVSAAFHSKYMEPALAEFKDEVSKIKINNPSYRINTNKSGEFVETGLEMMNNIITQIISPVNWVASMDLFKKENVSTLIELSPAGVLSNIAKRELKELTKLQITNPEDIFNLELNN